jgi:hypothetical protein
MAHQEELNRAAAATKNAVDSEHDELATNADAFSSACVTVNSIDDTSADVASVLGANAVAHERTRNVQTIVGWDDAWEDERVLHARLLRDLSGNPFRPVSIDPAWLAWHGGAVRELARVVYEEWELPTGHLDAGRLAVLADMLEEAGCTHAQLLGHLRSAGPHARGCHAVDAILGKE